MKSRKGISPVIAIILLLLMTVAAAGAAFLWVSKFQQQMADTTSSSWLDQQKAATAKLGIDAIWTNYTSTSNCIQDSNGTISFTIKNTGGYDFSGVDVNKIAIYINGALINALSAQTPCVNTTGGSLNQNDMMQINCGARYKPITTGTCPTVTVKITPAFGNGDEQSFQYTG